MIDPHSIKVLTVVKDKSGNNARYQIVTIKPQYWGDGALGFQLQRIDYEDAPVGARFWVRPEELASIYEDIN